ncbi:MAG TPA: transposase [Verrucomicrobiae bacterium]|nr:transposase [Verrucomicrobiae bacterium]
MARPIRVEFEGAVYHVMARGNERKAVFRDDKDRQRFLETLAEMVERFGVRVHAYCLMGNHYHLLVGTPRGNLSQAMGWLQVTYTVRFNRRHRRSGHLFQGRFKAHLVEADEYGRWLVVYVHLNPVRPRQKAATLSAERRLELERYAWSSHQDYAGLRKPAPWLDLDWLRYWGKSSREAQREYRKEVALAFGKPVDTPWEQLQGGLVLGGQGLLGRVHRTLGRGRDLEGARWAVQQSAGKIREQVQRLVKDEADDRVKIWARIRLGGERGIDVARAYGYRDGAGVTQVVRRLEQAAKSDKRLLRRLRGLRGASQRSR